MNSLRDNLRRNNYPGSSKKSGLNDREPYPKTHHSFSALFKGLDLKDM